MLLKNLQKLAPVAVTLVLLALTASGCGRRGKLEEPPDPAKIEADKARAASGDPVDSQRPRRKKVRPIARPGNDTPVDWIL